MARHSRWFRSRRHLAAGLAVAGLIALGVGVGAATRLKATATAGPGRSFSVHTVCHSGSRGCTNLEVGRLPERAARPVSAGKTRAPGTVPGGPFRVLQMNLCNSGLAGCFHDGNSPKEAARLVLRYQPVAVTLEEICYDDIYKPGAPLPSAMRKVAAGNGDGAYFLGFQPAWDRNTHAAYQCTGGRGEYGIGLLARGPFPGGHDGISSFGSTYPIQDSRDNEERAWLCLAVRGSFGLCATHLASVTPAVALRQCQYLMSSSADKPAVPWFRSRDGHDPVVVAGDLNLTYGGDPDVQACVPAGWFRKGDGNVQQVMATSNFGFVSSRAIGMADTDHPALLVDLTYPSRTGPSPVAAAHR